MSMKIITGKTGTPHVDSSDDAALYRAIIGVDYVLPNGSKFSYEVIDNNTIKINDGDILIQGHLGRIVPGDYENVTINNGTQGMKRNDLIVARYTKNTETGFENIELAVLEGTPGTTAIDPTLTVEDLTNGGTTRELPLYRVSLDGLSVVSVISLFKESSRWNDFKASGGIIDGNVYVTAGSEIAEMGAKRSINGQEYYSISKVGSGGQAIFGLKTPTKDDFALVFEEIEGRRFVRAFNPNEVELGVSAYPFKDIWLGGHSKESNGFNKLSNGFIEQWGSMVSTNTKQGDVNFPISFPNKTLSVVVTMNRADSTSHWVNIATESGRLGGFSWFSNLALSFGVGFRWRAIGY